MLTLAIETSTARGSVAWGNETGVKGEVFLQAAQRPSTTLFEALAELKVTSETVERVVVGIGPGSFSGIRVGLAAAYGFASVRNLPVWGINSAWAVAQQFKQVTRLGVFADAKRGEFYATIFCRGEIERTSFVCPASALENEIGKVTLAVSAESLPGVIERAEPRARDFLSLPEGSPLWVKEKHLEPIYLREAVK